MKDSKALNKNDIMPFGKYKGHKIGDLLVRDVSYMYWIITYTSLKLKPKVQDTIIRDYISLKNSQRKRVNNKPYYNLRESIFETMEEWI